MLGMTQKAEVVAVADGGQGLREEMESQLPITQFIPDKPHLRKHLYETAAALGLTEEQQRQWVHSRLDRISEGHVQAVLAELEAQNTLEPNDRLRRFIAYLKRFEDAVDYDRFKEAGYPIGSGEVEKRPSICASKTLEASWCLLASGINQSNAGLKGHKGKRLVE